MKKNKEPSASLTWVAPEKGELKINVDGALGEGMTDGAIACICRDFIGSLVAGHTISVKASTPA